MCVSSKYSFPAHSTAMPLRRNMSPTHPTRADVRSRRWLGSGVNAVVEGAKGDAKGWKRTDSIREGKSEEGSVQSV